MDLDNKIRENQKRIRELIAAMGVWLSTPNAQRPEVQARIDEHQQRALHKLKELEIEGQEAKISSMEAVLSLLRGQTKP